MNDFTEPTAMIVVSTISFLASIIATIISFRTKKSTEKLEKFIELAKLESVEKIENLKIQAVKDTEKRHAEKRRREKIIQRTNEELDKKIDALVYAIKATQQIKDEIEGLLTSCKEGATVSEAIIDMSLASDNITKNYHDKHTDLCIESQKLFHKTKNISMILPKTIETYAGRKKYIYDISNEGKSTLQQYKNQLTDIQEVLRDNRAKVVIERVQKND